MFKKNFFSPQPPETIQPKLKRRTSFKKLLSQPDSKQTDELIEKLKSIELAETEITEKAKPIVTKTPSPSPKKESLVGSPKQQKVVSKKNIKLPEINPLMPSTETPEAMVSHAPVQRFAIHEEKKEFAMKTDHDREDLIHLPHFINFPSDQGKNLA